METQDMQILLFRVKVQDLCLLDSVESQTIVVLITITS
jgi:hypothetical protein